MSGRPTGAQGLAALLSLAAYAGLAYYTPRPALGQFIALSGLATAAYWWLLRSSLPLRYGLLLALAVRLLWLPAVPALSDDYFRFRWDGNLVAAGHNPYLLTPTALLASPTDSRVSPLPPLTRPEIRHLYEQLNSPHYFSVYPPVCQAAFGLASRLFPRDAQGFILVLRLVILLAEMATALLLLRLLPHLGLPADQALRYLLNPLVVVELAGNLHFEALLICGLLAAVWLLVRGRWALSAAALAGAIATKLLPLLMLPLLARRLGFRPFLRYASLTAVVLLALFIPFISADLLRNLSRSLDLYFHKFEFNASLYYLLRAVGYWQTGYNQIARLGTFLALATGAGVLGLAASERRPTLLTLPRALLFVLTLYFALATTVHPWYLTTLVALSTLTHYRYALVWSALIPLSYAAYQTRAYSENLGLVALEYTVVAAVLLWEITRRPLLLHPE
ncbi:hypothetical protein [Hymenobacter chitinivorans]|uniref:DUF2029 domain-containing protein n=1 Tax=Hymenobacter chitinivorans DSM 11115 TaxID=1121954 RepID=A0A2M9BQ68_9BACT|nr:hypothetical protein [Hymenobacter chitinivorans]PJJ60058.1 hypothetical protein CLV45_1483 [Hymenobacter chitinivorans DSM 11115]